MSDDNTQHVYILCKRIPGGDTITPHLVVYDSKETIERAFPDWDIQWVEPYSSFEIVATVGQHYWIERREVVKSE